MPRDEDLHIGYVLKRYPRFSETFVVNEILAHERAGTRISIFALGPVSETHFQDCIARVRAPVTRLPDKPRGGDALWQLVAQARQQLPQFWPAMSQADGCSGDLVAQAIAIALAARERGIDHLHAHFATQATTVARLAAAFAGIGYSFTAHAKDIYFRYDEPVDLAAKLRDAAFAVTVSDYNLAHLRAGFGTDAAGALRLYNGLDTERFAYCEPVQRAPRILAVGRLIDKKGFHVLIEAARLLAGKGLDFDCSIIGDGPLRADLQAQIEQSGLAQRVRLLGPLPQPDVIEAMRAAAVLAAPCVVSDDGDRDGLPTVLLEAMALGAPCIATRVAGIPELVCDGDTGLCVDEGDPDALAGALDRLLRDEGLRVALAHAARAKIEREFDVHVNAAALRGMFRSAAGKPAGRPPDEAPGGRAARAARCA